MATNYKHYMTDGPHQVHPYRSVLPAVGLVSCLFGACCAGIAHVRRGRAASAGRANRCYCHFSRAACGLYRTYQVADVAQWGTIGTLHITLVVSTRTASLAWCQRLKTHNRADTRGRPAPSEAAAQAAP
jgi:hypothetical protein